VVVLIIFVLDKVKNLRKATGVLLLLVLGKFET